MNKQRFHKNFNGEQIFCLENDKETFKDMVLELQERNEKAINEVIRVLQIILEQPSKDKLDDLWIINKLEGIQTLLQGEDKDE